MDLIGKYNSRVEEKVPERPEPKFLVMSDTHIGDARTLVTEAMIEQLRGDLHEYQERILREMLGRWGEDMGDRVEDFSVTNVRQEGNTMRVDMTVRPRQAVNYINITTNFAADTPNRNGTIYTAEALRRGIEMHERYGGAAISHRGIASPIWFDEMSFVTNPADPTARIEASSIEQPITKKMLSPKDAVKEVLSND